MPYIKSDNDRRQKLQNGDVAQTAGELNYQIFYYLKHFDDNPSARFQVYIFIFQFLGENPNYQKYNDMVGGLTLCYKEIKRRLNKDIAYLLFIIDGFDEEIAKYEEEKIIENGDVE
jgi:hypothetical protein